MFTKLSCSLVVSLWPGAVLRPLVSLGYRVFGGGLFCLIIFFITPIEENIIFYVLILIQIPARYFSSNITLRVLPPGYPSVVVE